MTRILDIKEWEGIKTLAGHTQQPSPEAAEAITGLPLECITTHPSVFQPRLPLRADNTHKRKGHIAKLARALKDGESLPPLLIWKLKDQWVLLDGHHRLEAYRQVKEPSDTIPVRVFCGTFHEALVESMACNRNDKLHMTKFEAQNMAWKLVTEETGLSLRDIERTTGVSRGTVSRMKQLWEELKQNQPSSTDVCRTIPYCHLRKTFSQTPTHSHWLARQRAGIRHALAKNLGRYIRRWPNEIGEGIKSLYPDQAQAIGKALMSPSAIPTSTSKEADVVYTLKAPNYPLPSNQSTDTRSSLDRASSS